MPIPATSIPRRHRADAKRSRCAPQADLPTGSLPIPPPRTPGFDSFASACDALRALRHERGVLGSATPAGVRPSRVPPHLRPLPSTGITRLPQYCGASPPPCRPGLPLAGCRLARATPPPGFPVLPPSSSSMRAAVITPAEPAGARVARFPASGSLPHYSGGSASASPVSSPARRSLRVAAHMVAKPPRVARCIGVLQSKSLPPSTAPIATGWSDSCRAGFAPAEGQHLSTAHRIIRATGCSRPVGQGGRSVAGRRATPVNVQSANGLQGASADVA